MTAPSREVEAELDSCVARRQVSARLLALLAESELMVPMLETGPDRVPVVQREGQPYVPVFTRLELLVQAGGEASRYGTVTGRALAQSLDGDTGLLVNPAGTGLPHV